MELSERGRRTEAIENIKEAGEIENVKVVRPFHS